MFRIYIFFVRALQINNSLNRQFLRIAAPIDRFKALQDAGDSVSSDAAKQLKGMKVRCQVWCVMNICCWRLI